MKQLFNIQNSASQPFIINYYYSQPFIIRNAPSQPFILKKIDEVTTKTPGTSVTFKPKLLKTDMILLPKGKKLKLNINSNDTNTINNTINITDDYNKIKYEDVNNIDDDSNKIDVNNIYCNKPNFLHNEICIHIDDERDVFHSHIFHETVNNVLNFNTLSLIKKLDLFKQNNIKLTRQEVNALEYLHFNTRNLFTL